VKKWGARWQLYTERYAMLVGTKQWVVIIEGDVPVGAPDDVWRSMLAGITIPMALIQSMRGTRILLGTPEELNGPNPNASSLIP
jgi:hypothetical protein